MWNRNFYFVAFDCRHLFWRLYVNGTEVSQGTALVREIARNIERIESGNTQDRVCLYGTGEGSHSCICYRDTGHAGRHHCPCGAEWR